MNKFFSLAKATMTDQMSLIKIKSKKNNKLLSFSIILLLMFSIGASSFDFFKSLAPMHMQYVLLPLMAMGISFMTLVEGIYKSGPLLFNCSDDQLLFSLPISRRLVLFIRVLKFYVFELLFNSLFLLPFMISYIWWAENITWSYFLVSFVMILLLPIIPIVISCLIGFVMVGISSRFKYKNLLQTVLSFIILFIFIFISYNTQNLMEYLAKHASSVNDLITKIYYPAGMYGKLLLNFNWIDLLLFILINIFIFGLGLFILAKFYFKINSRTQQSIVKTKKNAKLSIKRSSAYKSLIKKEMRTFFSTPVFIVNSGFALVLFIVLIFLMFVKYPDFLKIISSTNLLNIPNYLFQKNLSIVVLLLLSFSSYMTSISNSVISLEGRGINILKSLPVYSKHILNSKILACLLITSPVFLLGNILLIIRYKIRWIEAFLILVLSILIPLVSHLTGLIINLKYPKLDATNSTEIVKQSTSSFLAVLVNIMILVFTSGSIINSIGKFSSINILLITAGVYVIVDILLYLFLTTWGIKTFNSMSI